jgi:hypothetical protein
MSWAYRGGIYSWGSICGSLPPAIEIIGLVTELDVGAKLINELMAWYKEFPFPEYQPAGMNIPTTVANSSLCHVSVTKWQHATGLDRDSAERKERCGGLTADVAKFTVEMLNKVADTGAFEGKFKPAAVVGECMTCHSKFTHGKESCTDCHGESYTEPHF